MSKDFDFDSIFNENTGYGALMWFLPFLFPAIIIGILIKMFINLNFKDCLIIGCAIFDVGASCIFCFINIKKNNKQKNNKQKIKKLQNFLQI